MSQSSWTHFLWLVKSHSLAWSARPHACVKPTKHHNLYPMRTWMHASRLKLPVMILKDYVCLQPNIVYATAPFSGVWHQGNHTNTLSLYAWVQYVCPSDSRIWSLLMEPGNLPLQPNSSLMHPALNLSECVPTIQDQQMKATALAVENPSLVEARCMVWNLISL